MRGTQFAELSAFVAVAEHRNFRKAAAQLGISAPTLSQTIRSFEERLGVRLLNRNTRSVAVTEAGARLLADAQPILEDIDQAIEAVKAFRYKPSGVLRLSMPHAIARSLVAPLLPRFPAAFPEIKLEIVADDTRSDIVRDRFDAGISIGERIAKDMIAVRLIDEFRMMAVASPVYLTNRPYPATPEDLHAHNCVRLRSEWDESIQPWIFENAGRRLEAAVDGSLVLNDMGLAVNAVLDGMGVGYLPEILISQHVANGRLVPLFDSWHGHVSGLFLYYPSRRQIPGTLRAFIDFMRAQARAIPASLTSVAG
jgi:DNA-binding transcriptional LysR family regulator